MAKTRHDTLDAGRQHLGSVYAKALLGAAEKSGQTDQVVEEIEALVSDVLDKLPTLEEALRTPRLTHEERLPILDKAFGGKMSPTLLTFLKVVSRHSRLDCLRAIARAARKQLDRTRGRVEVTIESVAPLSNPLKERIAGRLAQLLGKQVVLKTSLNENLLGGLLVRVGDTVYDASLAARLRRMEEVTLEQTKQQLRESLNRFAVST